MRYKNGVVQMFSAYPHPLAPLISKSVWDVFLATNQVRGGDLSYFISLVDSSLQWKEGDESATTIFAFH
jgi:hypothetical protein